MVPPRRWLRLPVLLGVAVFWPGQLHAKVESRVPLVDVFRGLADAESARRRGVEAVNPQSIAALNLARFAGLFAIGVVDREYGLRWIQTRSPTLLSTRDLQAAEQVCDVLLRRAVEALPTVVDRRELRTGGPGYIIAVPVRDRDRVVSFVVGLLSDDFDRATFVTSHPD